MSKKMEYIKKAVFYAKEKPETLAELLAGLVTDVFTDVVFTSAPVEVEIPKSDNTTVTSGVSSTTGVSTFTSSAFCTFLTAMIISSLNKI